MSDKVTEVKYLSNLELINELCEIKNPTWSAEERDRKVLLINETLRRLNEPWRQMRECVSAEQHKKEIKELTEKFFNNLNDLNYKSNMRHQINNIKRGLKPNYEKNELDTREYYG